MSSGIIEATGPARAGKQVLARMVKAGDVLIEQATTASITYAATDLATLDAVDGHDAVALVVADVVFDTPQTDAGWPANTPPGVANPGYNFKHTLSHTAFPEDNRKYLVRYTFTFNDGAPNAVLAVHFTTEDVARRTTLSDVERIASIKSRALKLLDELLLHPKPSYDLDGQAFSWNDYQRMLQAQVDWCNRQLDVEQPFEVHSQGYT